NTSWMKPADEAVARIKPWSGTSHPVTVALRAYVAIETKITAARTMPPKNSPNTRTDKGVASTTAPERRCVAWETASLRNKSLIHLPRNEIQSRILNTSLRFGKSPFGDEGDAPGQK